MDDETEMRLIREYLTRYPKDSSDIFTLLHEGPGREEFAKILEEADGRRIILYHHPEDLEKNDPPILWRYSKIKSPRR